MLLRNLHNKTPALKCLVAISIRRVPQRPDFHLAVTLRHLTRRPPLLVYVSLDHLCSGARRQISVFAFLQQSANHNLWISPRLNSGEPAVIFKLALTHRSYLCLERIPDVLRAAGLAVEIYALP